MKGGDLARVLCVRIGARRFGVPVAYVAEVFRPLPVEPVAGAPPFVSGVSIVRGAPTPVVTLHPALGEAVPRDGASQRFVALVLGGRRAALRVDAVTGIRDVDMAAAGLPPLLQGASAELTLAIGTLDAELLVVLRASRLFPDGEAFARAGHVDDRATSGPGEDGP